MPNDKNRSSNNYSGLKGYKTKSTGDMQPEHYVYKPVDWYNSNGKIVGRSTTGNSPISPTKSTGDTPMQVAAKLKLKRRGNVTSYEDGTYTR